MFHSCCCGLSCYEFREWNNQEATFIDTFEVVSGTWTYDANKIVGTAPGIVLLKPGFSGWHSQRVYSNDSWRDAAVNDKWRLLLDYIDADNHHFIEKKRIVDPADARFPAYEWQLGKRTAGNDTFYDKKRIAYSEDVFGRVWGAGINPQKVFANVEHLGNSAGGGLTSRHLGTRVGLQTITGNISFSSPSGTWYNGESSSCSLPSCSRCLEQPASLTLTVSGAANGSCNQCANLNGTFVLTPAWFDDYQSSASWYLRNTCDYASADFNLCPGFFQNTYHWRLRYHYDYDPLLATLELAVKSVPPGVGPGIVSPTMNSVTAGCNPGEFSFTATSNDGVGGSSNCILTGATFAVA